MTARVVKNEIKATLRKAIFEHPLSEEPARRVITPILNRVMQASEDSITYWAGLKDRVRLFYDLGVFLFFFFKLPDPGREHLFWSFQRSRSDARTQYLGWL